MDPWVAVLAAGVGYLIGAISFARIVSRLVAPQKDITKTELDVPGTDQQFRVHAVSATTVSLHLGNRYGGLVSVLDILKIVIPTLAIKIGYPGTPYHLITATMGMVGHIWPVYYRFKGGRGISTLYGGFLVVDWVGTLVTAFGGMLLGLLVFRDFLVSYLAGLWLMIPWLWFRTRDEAHLIYAVAVNIIFILGMIPEIRQYIRFRRRGIGGDLSVAMEATPMGKSMLKMAQRLGLMKKDP